MTGIPEEIADTPPSVKVVYLVLAAAEEPVSQHELADRSNLGVRQIRAALAKLTRYDCVEERPNLRDLRENHYEVDPSAFG